MHAHLAAVSVGLWGIAFGMLPAAIQIWMVRISSDQAEAAGGLLVAAFRVAIAGGAVLGGLLVDRFGALGATGYCSAAALFAAPTVPALSRRAP